MNPFDLPGEQFLVLFMCLSAATFLIAHFVHRGLRGPASPLEGAELSPIDYAFLSGGPARAVHAELAHLIDVGKLTYDQAADRLVRNGDVGGSTDLERAILDAGEKFTFTDAFGAALGPLTKIRERLEDLGLILTLERAQSARRMPLIVIGVLLGFGFIKIGVGLARNRPVGYLVAICVIVAVTALVMFARRMLTIRAENLLKHFRAEHAALRSTASTAPTTLKGNDLRMAVGLFGATILTGTALAAVHAAMLPAARAHGAYGSSGWSDTGGGTGLGGGCGGATGCGGGGDGGGGGGGCGGCGGGGGD